MVTRAVMVTVGAAWLLAMLVSGCAGAMLPLRANVGGGVAMGRPPNRDVLRGATSPVVTGRFLFAPLQLVAPAGVTAEGDGGGAAPPPPAAGPAEEVAPGRAALAAALSRCAGAAPAHLRIDAAIDGATGRIARFELGGAAASTVDRACVEGVLARVRFRAPLPELGSWWHITVVVARPASASAAAPPGGDRRRPSLFYRRFDFGMGYSLDAFKDGLTGAHELVHGPTLGLAYYPHVWRRPRSVGRFGVHAYADLLRHRGEWQGAGGAVGVAIEGSTFASGGEHRASRCAGGGAAAHGELGAGLEVAAAYRQLGETRYVTLTVSLTLRTPAVGFYGAVGRCR